MAGKLLFCTPVTEKSTQIADLKLSSYYVCGLRRDRSCPKLIAEMHLTCLKPSPGSSCLHRKYGSPHWYFITSNWMFFSTMVPPQPCCVVPLWVLPGWFRPMPPRRKCKPEEIDFDYLLQVPVLVWGGGGCLCSWSVRCEIQVLQHIMLTLCCVWLFSEACKEDLETEHFLRVTVLVQTTHCMQSSTICVSHELQEY